MGASVTVLLPVRNGEDYIEQAVRSVLSQSLAEVRLLVSDNGSTDATAAIVSRYLGDARVAYVRQPGGLDMLGHFNRCLDMVESEYYMLLCHDDFLFSPLALEKAHRALQASPRVTAVYCDLAYVDRAGALIVVRRFEREGEVESDVLARSAVVAARNLFGIPLLIRTRAVGSARYDADLPYAADLDLSIAISRGTRICHIPEPLIANRYHGSNATLGLFVSALGQMKRIAAKHAIDLSRGERLLMGINAWKTGLQKWLFFQYLDKLRSTRTAT